jgi:hypothetical protein
MPRTSYDPALVGLFGAPHVSLILMFEGFFATSTLRLWTGVGLLQYGGRSWQGAGELVGISATKETADLQAQGITVSLTGIDETIIAAAFNELRQGQPVDIYIAAYQFAPAPAMLAAPYCFFQGRVDVPTIDDSAETSMVTLQLENRLVDFERERVRYYDPQTQNTYFPGDRGFDYVASLQDQKIFWGVSN